MIFKLSWAIPHQGCVMSKRLEKPVFPSFSNDAVSNKMEKLEHIFTNSGLIDIREQIFGHFDLKTLEICREVFAQKFGEEWDSWLERFILIQFILEFGDKKVEFRKNRQVMFKDVKDLVPGWDKAVKEFSMMASLTDLDQVKGSLEANIIKSFPLHSAAENGHLKLLEFFFFTDADINEKIFMGTQGFTPFIVACKNGRTDIVNLMITSSKKFGIDLNSTSCLGYTGFMHACYSAEWQVVKLIITSSKEFGIDLNARGHEGYTGFMLACKRGQSYVVKLLINLSKEYGIDLNATNTDGDAGIGIARMNGYREIVNLMINSSEEFDIRTAFLLDLLEVATTQG